VAAPSASALWGLTLSRERGLFFLARWLLLAVPGIAALWRTRRATAGLIGFAAASTLLIIAGTGFWNGGNCVGPRYLVITVPFLAYAAVFAPRLWPARAWAVQGIGCGLAAAALLQLWFATATFPFHAPAVPDPI
jgi:hypothetical protein